MGELSNLFVWQFSWGFLLGMAVGGLLVLRAVRLAVAEQRGGYRGYTPPNAGRPILPQGGSGTAKPRRSFVDERTGQTCYLPDGWSSNYQHPES